MKRQSAEFILASSSPQRIRLVNQMGIAAAVQPVDLEEDHRLGDDAADLVEILALEKLNARLGGGEPRPDAIILAADTIVALDEHRLGKPADAAQAREFLLKLSGRTHEVLTSQALFIPSSLNPDTAAMAADGVPALRIAVPAPGPYGAAGIIVVSTAATHISIKTLADDEVDAYLEWEEWRGAAGGYRVQGRAGCFLDEMSGSYTNVVGLPIEALYGILRRTSFWS
jgi:septum formation protein